MSTGREYLLDLKRHYANNPLLWKAVDAVLAEEEVLKLPEVWAAEKYLRVRDPDGWRGPPVKQWRVEISEAEFDERAAMSTIELLPGHPDRLVPAPVVSDEGRLLIELAEEFLADYDGEMVDADDVHDWLVRKALKRGARP